MTVDSESFRRVLGHLPTGVTVITAHGFAEPVGMAANSIASVSLEPPMILLCPAKSSTTWPTIRDSGKFCVNVMASHHETTTRRFAQRGADRFDGLSLHDRPSGPALDDAVAWIDCAVRDEHDAGDHTIVLADVLGLDADETASPLIFFRGRYALLAPADEA